VTSVQPTNSQVWLDPSHLPTKGQITHYSAAPFVTAQVTGSIVGPAPNVSVTTTASRRLAITGNIITGSGVRKQVEWVQSLYEQM
jgi:hypothetical protein